MPDRAEHLIVSDLTGGRNAIDAPVSPLFRDTEAREMENVDFYRTTFMHKRNGTSTSGVTFSAGGPFTGLIGTIVRHVPGADEALAEMWAVDNASPPVVGRKAGATTWTAPTLKDNITNGRATTISAVSLNGNLFLAYPSAQDRLHVWAPSPDSGTVRRTGFATPAAPTVANTGAGSYAATIRYYRVRWLNQTVARRSEPGPSVSFTPSGAGTAARVTQPAVANESETHWEVEASADNVTFYLLATVAIGTTTYDDSAAVTSYSSGTLSATTGRYTTHTSYKFLAADQNRLIAFGNWTAANPQNRVWFSAVLGSLSVSDPERLDTTATYYVDLDEADSGPPTGLAGPLYGSFIAFKSHQVWELRPTGDVTRPYEKVAISKVIGAISNVVNTGLPRAYTMGLDERSRPCVYFMSARGMYRYGAMGLQYIGKGIEDFTNGQETDATTRLNLATGQNTCHMAYHPDKQQLWVWFATGSNVNPNRLAVFHVSYGCWTVYKNDDNVITTPLCSCMQSRTFGASFSLDLKPYMGGTSNNTIYMLDDANVTADNGAAFAGVAKLKLLNPWGPGYRGKVGEALLLAATQAGVTLTVRVLPEGHDASSEYTTGTALLTAVGSDIYASKRVENTALTGAEFVQYQIGEFANASTAWTVYGMTVPWWREDPIVG